MIPARVALLLAALAMTLGVHAAEPLALDGGAERVDLWPWSELLDDPQGELDALRAATHPRFEKPAGAYATLGMARGITWVRVPIRVEPHGRGEWVVDLDYARLRQVDAYLVREGRIVDQARMGSELPRASRPLRSRTPAALLKLPEAGTYSLLLRVDTPGAMVLPLALSRVAVFHARELDEQMLQGVLAGFALLLVLYSVVQWASLREPLYLKYAGLVAFSALFSFQVFGLADLYLWSDLAWPERHMAGVTALMASAATALFVEEALGSHLARPFQLALRGVAIFHTIAALAYGIDAIGNRELAVLMSISGLLPGLIGLPGAFRMARLGDSMGAWFILSWLGYFVAGAVMVGVIRGQVGANVWTLHSFQAGATLDMLVFLRIAVLRSAALRDARERLQRSFAGYVGPQVLEAIVEGRLLPEPGGEQRYVCVMFSDIRGYTARSEGQPPAEMLAFLNDYLDGVVQRVHRNGGTVVCFLGDGVMVVFGAPQVLANPCEAAWRTAREMLDHVEVVNARLRDQGHEPIEIGIGLHAGEAVVGHIGARERHEYAAIGDVTNVAARLQAATKDTGYALVVSGEVAAHLGPSASLAPLGALPLRGHSPVVAFGHGAVAEACAEGKLGVL